MAFLCPGFKGSRADYEDTEFQFSSGVESAEKILLQVTTDFQPTVDDEMGVSKGEIVTFLYRENHWNYVVNRTGQEGFIPAAYCIRSRLDGKSTPTKEKPLTKDSLRSSTRSITSLFKIRSKSHQELNSPAVGYGLESDLLPNVKLTGSSDDLLMSRKVASHRGVEKVSQFLKSLEEMPIEEANGDSFTAAHSSHQNLTYDGGKTAKSPAVTDDGYLVANQPANIPASIQEFRKEPLGQFVVTFDFPTTTIPTTPEDLAVVTGQLVTALNCDDPDWTFVRSADGQEGFVPRSYLSPVDRMAKEADWKLKVPTSPDWGKLTELLAIDNFTPEAQDDLAIVRGDRIFTQRKSECLANLDCFIWAFSPRLNQHGFVPLSHVSVAN